MVAVTEKVDAIIRPPLEAMGYVPVRVKLFEGDKGRRTLQIMAERADQAGMTVEDCSEISRMVSTLLDVEDPITGAYNLEVSSPGVDRPLVTIGDFERFAGYAAKIETTLPIEGRRRFKGTLRGVADGQVKIATDAGEISIAHANVHEAKLVLTEELLRAYLKKQA